MRNIYLLAFCCFLAACHNNAGNNAPGKDEPDLTALTNKKFMLDRGPGALNYLDSLYRAQKNKTPYIQAGRYMSLANYSIDNSQAGKAITYVDSAIAIIDKQDLSSAAWKNYYFSAHVLKGNRFFAKGNYAVAMDNFFKAKELADKTENTCNINDQINNYIGLVLYKQKKYDDAKEYFKAAYELIKTCPGDQYKASGEQLQLDNVALCFSKEGKSDSALAWYHKALRLTETDSDKFNRDPAINKLSKEVCRGIISGNIAQILVRQNKLDSAELLFKRNIYINSVLHKNEIGDAQLSETYLADLYDLKGEYPKMKQVLDGLRKSLDSQHSLHNQDAELGWRRLMVEYYHKQNLQPKEFKYYKSFVTYRDSLDSARRESSQLDLNNELKTREQQLQISLLQKDNQLDRAYLWITVGLSALASGIVVLIYYYYRRGKKNIRTLTLLNREVGEQKDQLEFAMGELKKSNTDRERILKVVAHDLRNPISGISRLAATVIDDDDISPEDELKSLSLIKSASDNSLSLINELLELELDHAQIALDKAPADINETVRHCIALMQLIADKKHQKLQLIPLPDSLIINMDSGRIERMINNLLSNAIKFSPTAEKISVELEQKPETAIISVSDKGIGIPPELQTELFNTFGAARRKGTAGEKSFGLGLSISKQIVEAHNGKIWMESAPGSGSVFYVELPL
jgi:signal transduction histidine kinase